MNAKYATKLILESDQQKLATIFVRRESLRLLHWFSVGYLDVFPTNGILAEPYDKFVQSLKIET